MRQSRESNLCGAVTGTLLNSDGFATMADAPSPPPPPAPRPPILRDLWSPAATAIFSFSFVVGLIGLLLVLRWVVLHRKSAANKYRVFAETVATKASEHRQRRETAKAAAASRRNDAARARTVRGGRNSPTLKLEDYDDVEDGLPSEAALTPMQATSVKALQGAWRRKEAVQEYKHKVAEREEERETTRAATRLQGAIRSVAARRQVERQKSARIVQAVWRRRKSRAALREAVLRARRERGG